MAEYNASGALLNRYIHGAGSDDPLVWYTGTGTGNKRYLLADERDWFMDLTEAEQALFAKAHQAIGDYAKVIEQTIEEAKHHLQPE